MEKVKVGIIGCGKICDIYFKNMKSFPLLEVIACADLDISRAEQKAKEYNIPLALCTEDLLNNKDIEIVVNLTVPKAHYEIAKKAINAKKSVYNEKPLTISREEGKELLKIAEKNKVLVGCAPDTFLGAGIQTCIDVINEGKIGNPVAATAFMVCHGHESWHPSPEFYYEKGGGPMFDMGPYYLTALVNMLGPVKRVSGSAKISFPERTITSEPKKGKIIKVETPTHLTGTMDFLSGATCTIITSFDVWATNLPIIEIYGSEGSLSVPDPNSFSGPVKIKMSGEKEWKEIPVDRAYSDNSRGLGVLDMASSILNNRPNRANGKMAYHVLDVMHSFLDSSNTDKHIYLKSSFEKIKSLPKGLKQNEID